MEDEYYEDETWDNYLQSILSTIKKRQERLKLFFLIGLWGVLLKFIIFFLTINEFSRLSGVIIGWLGLGTAVIAIYFLLWNFFSEKSSILGRLGKLGNWKV